MSAASSFFLTNNQSIARALAWAHHQAQESYLAKSAFDGLTLDDAEQLLNASIPNHMYKTHVLGIRLERSNDWFLFQKKHAVSDDLEPFLVREVNAARLGLTGASSALKWIELCHETKRELNDTTRVNVGPHSISLELLLSPVCTLSRTQGRLEIELPFARCASLERLKALVENPDNKSQFLGFESLYKWLEVNQRRPASEQTKLAAYFHEVLLETNASQMIELIIAQQMLVCSGTEPCGEDGLIRSEFLNPTPAMLDGLHSQGLEAAIQLTHILDAAEMKNVAELYFSDILHLLQNLPD